MRSAMSVDVLIQLRGRNNDLGERNWVLNCNRRLNTRLSSQWESAAFQTELRLYSLLCHPPKRLRPIRSQFEPETISNPPGIHSQKPFILARSNRRVGNATRRDNRQTSESPLPNVHLVLRPLRTIPVVWRRGTDRLTGTGYMQCDHPFAQQTRPSCGLFRQLSHHREIWGPASSNFDIGAPNDLLVLCGDIRRTPERLGLFLAREVDAESKRVILRVVRIVREGVAVDVLIEITDRHIDARPHQG